MKTIKIALLLALSAGPVLAKDIKQIRWGVDGGYPPFDVLAPTSPR
ncbi:hypothetical protein [Chromobacterium haemolyticum]|nr:hypothetical protein [Chromobacterium haemolyticum]